MITTKGIFRLGMIIRITALAVTCLLIVYIALETYFWLVAFWLLLLLIIQIAGLMRYAERSRIELVSFLVAISQNDYSGAYTIALKSNRRDELKQALITIQNKLTVLRDEKEKNHQYLKTIVEHIRIALVCFDEEYKVQLFNKAAQKLFQKRILSSIQSFEKIDETLASQIVALKPNQKVVVKYIAGNELLNLSMQSTGFVMGETRYKIISFQDISYELEEKETDSWQKLIGVIAHEINNSVIPISTLSHTLREMLEEAGNLAIADNTLAYDIKNGLKSIESRSAGLVDFVQSTKRLRQISDPEFSKVRCREIFDQVIILISPILQERKITGYNSITPEEMCLLVDRYMIEQTLINLLMNAIDATQHTTDPVIHLAASLTGDNRPVISVKDNGPGIEPENADKIFIPYFTTKSGGTGIGLSIARRIMQLHKGSISVHSDPGGETEFTLRF